MKPAIAAVELGFFAREALDVTLEPMVPIDTAFATMLQFSRGAAILHGDPAHEDVVFTPTPR